MQRHHLLDEAFLVIAKCYGRSTVLGRISLSRSTVWLYKLSLVTGIHHDDSHDDPISCTVLVHVYDYDIMTIHAVFLYVLYYVLRV